MIEAHPLHWPDGWSRTKHRQKSKFKVSSFAKCRNQLLTEVKLLGGSNIILSTNIPTNSNGVAADKFAFASLQDPGVAVYFQYKGKARSFACDRWDRVQDNVNAVRLSIEAIRGLARWGSSDMLERAFTGFQALPPAKKDWWEVLEVPRSASVEEIRSARNRLALHHHPDRGGSTEMSAKINTAYDQALSERV